MTPLASVVGFTALDRLHSSYLIMLTLVAIGVAAYLLYRVGVIGAALWLFGVIVRGSVRGGFQLWESLFAWATWPVFLVAVIGLITLGSATAGVAPWLAVTCGLAALVMGVSACLAYMYIDLERYQVERGYKAVHDPMKGQDLAVHLNRYGDRVGVPLLATAAVGAVGGLALTDPSPRLRKVALDAVAALGPEGVRFLDALRVRAAEEEDQPVREVVIDLISRLERAEPAAESEPREPTEPIPTVG